MLFLTKSADGGINPTCVGLNRFAMKSALRQEIKADLISFEALSLCFLRIKFMPLRTVEVAKRREGLE